MDCSQSMEVSTYIPASSDSSAAKNSSPKTTTKSEPSLRQLSSSDFHFWRTSTSEQFSLSVFDQKSDGSKRPLPKNEIAAMALNEIAVQHKRGFFLHLPSRKAWTSKPPSGAICPPSRLSPQPRAQFPSLLYTDYVWTEEACRAYHNASHRSRYLLCDGFINTPYNSSSLYAIQYITDPKIAVYATASETLIILANSSSYYPFLSSEFEDFVGRWGKKKPLPKGPEPELRLRTTPYIWEEDVSKISSRDREILDGMQEHQVPDIQKLYENILQRCHPDKLAPTFTTREFRDTIPRPPAPDIGVALGTPLRLDDENQAEDVAQGPSVAVLMDPLLNDSSNPPSRKGGRLRRDGTGQKRGEKRIRKKESKRIGDNL